MENLYEETINSLKENNKSIDDILWIGCDEFSIPIENFIEVSKRTVYYSGYGHPEVASDLKIVGNDFLMIRNEYDGSEWWDFISYSHNKPTTQFTVDKLAGGMWDGLATINNISQ